MPLAYTRTRLPSAEVLPQRHAGAARRDVPERLVDRADDLRERARLAALDRHPPRALLEQRAHGRGVVGVRAGRAAARRCSSTRRARCSAPTCGKLLNTSPQPRAPSLAVMRRNTAGRFVIAPNAFATGSAIGARSTQHSTFSMRVSMDMLFAVEFGSLIRGLERGSDT